MTFTAAHDPAMTLPRAEPFRFDQQIGDYRVAGTLMLRRCVVKGGLGISDITTMEIEAEALGPFTVTANMSTEPVAVHARPSRGITFREVSA